MERGALFLFVCAVFIISKCICDIISQHEGNMSVSSSTRRPHGPTMMQSSELQTYNDTLGDDYPQYVDEGGVNVTEYNNMLNETWLDLTSVMDLYTQREHDNNSAVQALTAAYRYTLKQQKKLKTLPSFYKKAFYAIEGLDIEKRDMLANRLALHIQGQVVINPPDTFDVVVKHLPPNNTQLQNGFHVLCTYISALHVRYVTQKGPAIVPGYWLGRAALTIARAFPTKPPPFASKFWVWPKDLIKPDIVFYICDRSDHQFDDHKLVQRYFHVFDNWLDPKCIPLENSQSIDAMMEEIEPYLNQRRHR